MDEEKKQRAILLAVERIKREVFSLEDHPSLKEMTFEQALEILDIEKKLYIVCPELMSSLTKSYNSKALDIILTRFYRQQPREGEDDSE